MKSKQIRTLIIVVTMAASTVAMAGCGRREILSDSGNEISVSEIEETNSVYSCLKCGKEYPATSQGLETMTQHISECGSEGYTLKPDN